MIKLKFVDKVFRAANSWLERCRGTLALQLRKDVKAVILVFIKSFVHSSIKEFKIN